MGERPCLRVTYSTSASSAQALAGQAIAVRVTGDPDPTNNGLFYLHSDHLGSTSAMSNSSGQLVGEVTRYYPFGDYRSGGPNAITDRGFTGQKENMDLGLYYYNARYYVPYLNRFISADTIVPDPSNLQSFNRYAYALNNPVRYRDPSGHCVVLINDYGESCYNESVNHFKQGTAFQNKYEVAIANYIMSGNESDLATLSELQSVTFADKFIIRMSEAAYSHVAGDGSVAAIDQAVSGLQAATLTAAGMATDKIATGALTRLWNAGANLWNRGKSWFNDTFQGQSPEKALTTTPSIAPGSQEHHPPGWNENWEWRGSSSRGQGMRWWDTEGGEWRWHPADKWHPSGHWDYNPWRTWNDAWQNIPETRISPPVAP